MACVEGRTRLSGDSCVITRAGLLPARAELMTSLFGDVFGVRGDYSKGFMYVHLACTGTCHTLRTLRAAAHAHATRRLT